MALLALARLTGDSAVAFEQILRLTYLFAGVPATLTAGGIGRLAARVSASRRQPRVRRAMWVAGRAFAVAGIGLILIAAIPLGQLPEDLWRWWLFAATGLVVGGATGAVIGFWAAVGNIEGARTTQPHRAIRDS
jgi:hypothetical protein